MATEYLTHAIWFLVLVCGLCLGLTVGCVVTATYWAARARTQQAIVHQGERFVVLLECDFLTMCRQNRARTLTLSEAIAQKNRLSPKKTGYRP